jgi:hypothetical protein
MKLPQEVVHVRAEIDAAWAYLARRQGHLQFRPIRHRLHLSQALMLTGMATQTPACVDAGLRSLRWPAEAVA